MTPLLGEWKNPKANPLIFGHLEGPLNRFIISIGSGSHLKTSLRDSDLTKHVHWRSTLDVLVAIADARPLPVEASTRHRPSWLVNQPNPQPLRNKGSIAGLIRGKPTVNKPLNEALFLGGYLARGGYVD